MPYEQVFYSAGCHSDRRDTLLSSFSSVGCSNEMGVLMRVDEEREYWDKYAQSPDVDRLYISDVSTEECIRALNLEDSYLNNILEVGCGIGRLMDALPDSALIYEANPWGVDISLDMLDEGQKRHGWNHQFIVNDGRTIPFTDGFFEFVYCVLVFQHLPGEAIRSYIKETYRVLQPQGIFRFQYIEGTEQEPFSRHYNPETMRRWLTDEGFEITQQDRALVHKQWSWITAVKP